MVLSNICHSPLGAWLPRSGLNIYMGLGSVSNGHKNVSDGLRIVTDHLGICAMFLGMFQMGLG